MNNKLKNIFLFLDALWILALIWIPFVYIFFVFSGGIGMKQIWMIFGPAVLSSLLVIPLNLLHLHFLARCRGWYSRLSGFLLPKLNIILPPLVFIYLAFSFVFIFPSMYEFFDCVFFGGAGSTYCHFIYIRDHLWLRDSLLFLSWLVFSALLSLAYSRRIKKDKKSLLGILVVIASFFIMYWLVDNY